MNTARDKAEGTHNTSPAEDSALDQQGVTTLWLIRHAEVEEAYQGIFGGRIDMGLSPRGHQQAAKLAAWLHRQRFAAFYASPMKRVAQTLAPLLLNGTPKPVILPDLVEVDFGDWTGLSWEEVQAKFGISAFAWLEQLESDAIANAECAEAFRDRVEPCIRAILRKHPSQPIAIACHGGVIRMILSILLNWPLPRLGSFEVEYASVTQVLLNSNKATLQLLNFTPWRELGS